MQAGNASNGIEGPEERGVDGGRGTQEEAVEEMIFEEVCGDGEGSGCGGRLLWYDLGWPVITSEIGNWSVFVLLGWRFVFEIIMK